MDKRAELADGLWCKWTRSPLCAATNTNKQKKKAPSITAALDLSCLDGAHEFQQARAPLLWCSTVYKAGSRRVTIHTKPRGRTKPEKRNI